MIYLDAAATGKYRDVDNIIVDTITYAMKNYWQNPSSLYASHVKEEIDRCRKVIAEFVGAKPDEIIFTSGSSESNNWAIRGWVDCMLQSTTQNIHVITTPIEHKSLMEVVQYGIPEANVSYCSVDKYGCVDLESLKNLLMMCEYNPVLVSIGLANNEIGVIQDIKVISRLVHKYGGILHVDATQAVAHIPVNVEELGIDMMSVSGHKISPVLRGIGCLYKKNEINIHPLIYGVQERHERGGTENTYGIIGLARAIELCDVSDKKIKELCDKRNYFLNLLESKFDCKLNGDRKNRLPNNISLTFLDNIFGESILYSLSASDIFVSTSSACNSHSIEPSYVLKSIGLNDNESMSTIRITIPDDITYEDIDCFIVELDKIIKIIKL